MNTVGHKIKNYRLEKGLSIRELSIVAKVDVRSIQYYESGAIKPKTDNAIRLAKALDVSVEELFGDGAEDEEE